MNDLPVKCIRRWILSSLNNSLEAATPPKSKYWDDSVASTRRFNLLKIILGGMYI